MDETNIQNKQIKRKDAVIKEEVALLPFYFPDYNITILAKDRAEAERKIPDYVQN